MNDAYEAGLQSPTCLIPTDPKVEMNDYEVRPRSVLKEACSAEEWQGFERLNRGPVSTDYKYG